MVPLRKRQLDDGEATRLIAFSLFQCASCVDRMPRAKSIVFAFGRRAGISRLQFGWAGPLIGYRADTSPRMERWSFEIIAAVTRSLPSSGGNQGSYSKAGYGADDES